MPKGRNQTLKALFLRDILLRETDAEHPMTAEELIEALDRCGVSAERKSIYDDLDKLSGIYGLNIELKKGKNGGYYVEDHEFEISELKILVDVVQSCRFISEKKSQRLIAKLETLTNKYAASELQHQVYIQNRAKSTEETIYYTIDSLNEAINRNVQVEFRYYEYTVTKQKTFRRGGSVYRVSPFALLWNDSFYYLVCFDHKDNIIKHFRVDKMTGLSLCAEPRTGHEHFPEQGVAGYSKQLFGMFGGREENVRLRLPDKMVNVVIDRFGQEVSINPYDAGEGHFTVSCEVQISPQFYGWVFGLGRDVEILSPTSVREEYQQYLQNALDIYQPTEKVGENT